MNKDLLNLHKLKTTVAPNVSSGGTSKFDMVAEPLTTVAEFPNGNASLAESVTRIVKDKDGNLSEIVGPPTGYSLKK